jgi:FkbM family methyltransferase
VVPTVLRSLTRERASNVPRAGGWTAELVRRHGADPATVVDVGAGAGTPALYEAFPHAHHVLIEPLREFEDDLKAYVKELRAEHIMVAVGARLGEVTLHVPGDLYTTSALPPAAQTATAAETREVPLTTLDTLLRERRWTAPYCLKMDVEGYEHAVIEGARDLLGGTELVIAEVSVTNRFHGGVTSLELIDLMRSRGFEVVDVIDAASTGHGVHADVVFKPRAAVDGSASAAAQSS